MIKNTKSDIILNSLVGFFGLIPTIKSLEFGKKVALANKESLVIAGNFIDMEKIIPIDSEHFSLWYLMKNKMQFSKLYITASGGAFRDYDIKNMKNVSFQDALKHPNWSMGNKITIDSATMINKLFEILEAKWLFQTEQIDAFIEKKSIIHALVEFIDGSTLAHFANADMKLPISFSLGITSKKPIIPPVNLLEIGSFEFKKIDSLKYPIWDIKNDILKNTHLGVVINASNEEAIKQFSRGEISFFQISNLILESYEKFKLYKAKNIEEIIEIDKEVRTYIQKKL